MPKVHKLEVRFSKDGRFKYRAMFCRSSHYSGLTPLRIKLVESWTEVNCKLCLSRKALRATKVKVCRDCNEPFPIGEFWKRPDGRPISYCKECHSKRGYRSKGLAPRKPKPKEIEGKKWCRQCGSYRPLNTKSFYFNSYLGKYTSPCKHCRSLARKRFKERTKYICHRCKEQVRPEVKEE